ncbi:unnamed protein product [Polarella glacialis]|uniref:Uncharacterized protein n=1 Tax=Polarella glacialis TaxID=89957 RepID=A0A813KM23_POLGL|nr:unnamed protein product [Polarella glacialis]
MLLPLAKKPASRGHFDEVILENLGAQVKAAKNTFLTTNQEQNNYETVMFFFFLFNIKNNHQKQPSNQDLQITIKPALQVAAKQAALGAQLQP